MRASKKDELSYSIIEELQNKQIANIDLGNSKQYDFHINITDYAVNESLSWEMMLWILTLLQPIYIDAHVVVTTFPDGEKYAEFDIENYKLCPVNAIFTCANRVKKGFARDIANAVTTLEQ